MCYCPQLEPIIGLANYQGDFTIYEKYLYNVFLESLFSQPIYYNGLPIYLKKYPVFKDKESSFYHLTCKDFNHTNVEAQREPDLIRCERLHWIKPAIETNHISECHQTCFYIYNKEVRNKTRLHFFNPQDRYMIVLEKRETYYLLITAYYIEYDNMLNKKLREYEDNI